MSKLLNRVADTYMERVAKMAYSTRIWERRGVGTMSKNLYLLAVCFWTAAGLAVSAASSAISRDWQIGIWFALGVTVVAILGVIISMVSDNPLISLVGYALVAIPFGLLLGPVVAMYTTASVFRVLFLTTSLVAVLGVIGAIIPDSLEHWGGWLCGALWILLAGYLIVPLGAWLGVPVGGAMTLLDWIGVALFSVMVVYDLNRAVRLPHTMDNAIDSAVAVYLDFLNIFIRLLSLTGQKSDD